MDFVCHSHQTQIVLGFNFPLKHTFFQTVLLYQYKRMTVMLSFILNLLILDGIFALFGAVYRGPGIINTEFYEVQFLMFTS